MKIANLFVLMCVGVNAYGSAEDFSKADRKCVQKIIGYGLDDASMKRVFIHSSHGNTEFEALETLGDSYVQGCAAGLTRYRSGITEREMHRSLESKTTNEFLAEKFQRSGLAIFAKVSGTPEMTTVYANMFEVLFAVIAERYFAQHPHLRESDSGRVYKVLTPVFKRLTEDQTPVFLPVHPAVASSSKKTTLTLSVEKDGRRYAQKASGKTEEEAETIALRGLWSKLDTGSKSKHKSFSTLKQLAEVCGWTIVTH